MVTICSVGLVKYFEVINKNILFREIREHSQKNPKYYYTKPNTDKKIKILFPSRMLWDKGVKELREATEILSTVYKNKIVFIFKIFTSQYICLQDMLCNYLIQTFVDDLKTF